MGVYHSHSIQIARLIERAHSFARPPSATPLRLNVSQASSHLGQTSSVRRTSLSPLALARPLFPQSTVRQTSFHRAPIAGLVFSRKQIVAWVARARAPHLSRDVSRDARMISGRADCLSNLGSDLSCWGEEESPRRDYRNVEIDRLRPFLSEPNVKLTRRL